MYALMDDRLLQAFGFPKPPEVLRALVLGSMLLRARLVRYLPEPRTPVTVSSVRHRSYPRGYRIDDLGP